MKNIMTVEIKDNKTIVTIAKRSNGEYSLLNHITYLSRPLTKSNPYDYDIVNRIVNDLKDMNIFNDIDEKYLTINTKHVRFTTYANIEYAYNTDLEEEKAKFKRQLERKFTDLTINKLVYSDTEKSYTKKNISITVEAINTIYQHDIMERFKVSGIKFDGIIPVLDVITNITKKQAIDEGVTHSILLEEKFMQLTSIENGVLISSKKYNMGLSNIYQHVADQMGIEKHVAKKLFKSFGSIPPEDVVDDKVIHAVENGNELTVFTKKDLSSFITEKVNQIFSYVKDEVYSEDMEGKTKRIIFNGEIKTLLGFKKYAANSFAEPNIKKYKSNTIGFDSETEFISMGMLIGSEKFAKQEKETKKEVLYRPKINVLSKMFSMYNYI